MKAAPDMAGPAAQNGRTEPEEIAEGNGPVRRPNLPPRPATKIAATQPGQAAPDRLLRCSRWPRYRIRPERRGILPGVLQEDWRLGAARDRFARRAGLRRSKEDDGAERESRGGGDLDAKNHRPDGVERVPRP